MPIGPARMPFMEHIAELRRRLMIVVTVVFVGALVIYTWAWPIFDYLLAPAMKPLAAAGVDRLVLMGPLAGFTLRFKVALYAAIAASSPVIIWQVMAFFLPALRPREKRYVVPTFVVMVLLFLFGAAFCYYVIEPKAIEWFVNQGAAQSLAQLPSAELWFQTVMVLLLAFGLSFELPVIVFYLLIFNIVPYDVLSKNWRVVFVVLTTVAAIATPDWSPVTMGALSVALIVLYLGSMLLARVVLRRRIKAAKLREQLEEQGLDETEIDARLEVFRRKRKGALPEPEPDSDDEDDPDDEDA
jgi:sec-independent protein translocase protein TatC